MTMYVFKTDTKSISWKKRLNIFIFITACNDAAFAGDAGCAGHTGKMKCKSDGTCVRKYTQLGLARFVIDNHSLCNIFLLLQLWLNTLPITYKYV